MTFFVYMLKATNPKINKTYIGYTNNLKNRLEKHNSNKGAKATRGYEWKIIYTKKFISKNKAMSYEYMLKNNRQEKKKILDSVK